MQIDRLKIAPLAWAEATVEVSHSASPAGHLLTDRREQMFYSAAAVDDQPLPTLTIDVRWPYPVPLDVICIDRHNLSGSALVQHWLYEDGEEVYDSEPDVAGIPIPPGEWLPGIHHIGETYDDALPSRASVRYLDEPVFADHWRIVIDDPDNPDRQIAINRLPCGMALQLDNNFSWGATLTVVDSTEHLALSSGGVASQLGTQYRRLEMSMDWLTQPDASHLQTVLARDKSQLLFVSAYPTPPASGPPNGGVQELAHQMVAVRDNDIAVRRSNALFSAAPLSFREV